MVKQVGVFCLVDTPLPHTKGTDISKAKLKAHLFPFAFAKLLHKEKNSK